MKNHQVYSLGLTQAKGPEPGDGHNLEEKGDTAWKRHPPLKGTMQMRDLPWRRASPWGGPHPGWPITYSIYYFTFTLLLKSKMTEHSLTKPK